jgi:hypothetical protein
MSRAGYGRTESAVGIEAIGTDIYWRRRTCQHVHKNGANLDDDADGRSYHVPRRQAPETAVVSSQAKKSGCVMVMGASKRYSVAVAASATHALFSLVMIGSDGNEHRRSRWDR